MQAVLFLLLIFSSTLSSFSSPRWLRFLFYIALEFKSNSPRSLVDSPLIMEISSPASLSLVSPLLSELTQINFLLSSVIIPHGILPHYRVLEFLVDKYFFY